jgi:hypothetical protein
VTPALMELHWLSAVDRVNFKVATLLYRCLHDLAPPYLASSLHREAELDSRRRLRSSVDTDILLVPRSRLVTAGDRSFPVAGPRIWNNLPETVRSAPSLFSFKQRLKTVLFSRHYIIDSCILKNGRFVEWLGYKRHGICYVKCVKYNAISSALRARRREKLHKIRCQSEDRILGVFSLKRQKRGRNLS